jgi:hypothetical protein
MFWTISIPSVLLLLLASYAIRVFEGPSKARHALYFWDQMWLVSTLSLSLSFLSPCLFLSLSLFPPLSPLSSLLSPLSLLSLSCLALPLFSLLVNSDSPSRRPLVIQTLCPAPLSYRRRCRATPASAPPSSQGRGQVWLH